jgi:hypothetical protein
LDGDKVEKPDDGYLVIHPVVYPHPLKHFLGEYSAKEAYAYNAPDSLIMPENLAQAGYNDNVYLDNIRKMMTQLTGSDCSPDKTAAVAFSQGGAFLHQYLTRTPDFAETVGFVGTAFTPGAPKMKPGNGQDIMEVNLHGDQGVLPKNGIVNQSWDFIKHSFEHTLVDATADAPLIGRLQMVKNWRKYADAADSLAPIRQDRAEDTDIGQGQELGLYDLWGRSLASPFFPLDRGTTVPFGSNQSDTVTTLRGHGHTMQVIDLQKAGHVWPGGDPNIKTCTAPAYEGAPVSEYFANMFADHLRRSTLA